MCILSDFSYAFCFSYYDFLIPRRYIGIILGWPSLYWQTKVILVFVVDGLGLLIIFIFGIYWRRKQNEKKLEMQMSMADQVRVHIAEASARSADV